MTTLRHLATVSVLGALLALAACSSGGDDAAPTTSASDATTSTSLAASTSSLATTTSSSSTSSTSTTLAVTTVPATAAPATTAKPVGTTRPGTRPSIEPGCPAQGGAVATLVIGVSGLTPQCLSIYPDQSLKVVNNAEGDAQLSIGDAYTTPVLGPGDFLTTEPVGTGLGRDKALTVVCTCYPDNQGTLVIGP